MTIDCLVYHITLLDIASDKPLCSIFVYSVRTYTHKNTGERWCEERAMCCLIIRLYVREMIDHNYSVVCRTILLWNDYVEPQHNVLAQRRRFVHANRKKKHCLVSVTLLCVQNSSSITLSLIHFFLYYVLDASVRVQDVIL